MGHISVWKLLFPSWAENFRMGDIQINAWSSLFLNIEPNLILYLYPENLEWNIQPIRSREIWNFARH